MKKPLYPAFWRDCEFHPHSHESTVSNFKHSGVLCDRLLQALVLQLLIPQPVSSNNAPGRQVSRAYS